MSDIINQRERAEFNLELFRRRGFIRAKYFSWDEPRMGLIVFAMPDFLKVLFLAGMNSATSYYVIKIREVEQKLWTFTYSPDMKSFYVFDGETEKAIELPIETALTDTIAGGQSIIGGGLTLFAGRLIHYGTLKDNGNVSAT